MMLRKPRVPIQKKPEEILPASTGNGLRPSVSRNGSNDSESTWSRQKHADSSPRNGSGHSRTIRKNFFISGVEGKSLQTRRCDIGRVVKSQLAGIRFLQNLRPRRFVTNHHHLHSFRQNLQPRLFGHVSSSNLSSQHVAKFRLNQRWRIPNREFPSECYRLTVVLLIANEEIGQCTTINKNRSRTHPANSWCEKSCSKPILHHFQLNYYSLLVPKHSSHPPPHDTSKRALLFWPHQFHQRSSAVFLVSTPESPAGPPPRLRAIPLPFVPQPLTRPKPPDLHYADSASPQLSVFLEVYRERFGSSSHSSK